MQAGVFSFQPLAKICEQAFNVETSFSAALEKWERMNSNYDGGG